MCYLEYLHGSHLLSLVELGKAMWQAARPAPVAGREALVALALALCSHVQTHLF